MEKFDVPVLLLTGYLGNGKTTLLNRILSNRRGIRFAVIVNDIGEVNIDADLIQKGGIVGSNDDSLVALQNGCICCTLKMDLVQQLYDIIALKKFDYIVIEASGICEPEPIAQTIYSMAQMAPEITRNGLPYVDCIVTVVDALRLKDEFDCGSDLTKKDIDEEDIENLVIQQIEFCNIVLLNKAADVEPHELERIRQIVRGIQKKAQIIECNYGDVELDKLLNTNLFDYEKVATSATWIAELEGHHDDDDDDDDEHEHEHHHHEHDEHHHEHEHHHHHHDHEDHDHHDHHDHDHHHHHHHGHEGHHHADEVFSDIGEETTNKYTMEQIQSALETLQDEEKCGQVLRAKGIVEGTDGQWIHFDYVPGEPQVRTGSAETTGMICVIGVDIKQDTIREMFGL